MNEKEKIINETVSIMEKVEDEKVLKDMQILINCVYRNYNQGKWGR